MRSHLWVEGPNDAHVLCHVLSEAGFKLHFDACADPNLCLERVIHVRLPRTRNWTGVRDQIRACAANEGDRVGYVFDMDSPEHQERPWPSVRDALASRFKDDVIPEQPPEDGWKGVRSNAPIVGFWAMPRGPRAGAIEDFLWEGVPLESPLRPIVLTAVAEAERVHPRLHREGTTGRLVAAWRPKAQVHSWLALQAEPGKPLGQAWKANLFLHGTEGETAFVSWAVSVFGTPLPMLGPPP